MKTGAFEITGTDDLARVGVFHTAHGVFATPAFMPVGTQATVKGVTPRDLKESGAEIVLANTYHLHLRPSEGVIAELGGIHRFMGWDGPILTDSGGFQIFSLSKLRKLTPDGVTFQSHIDGKEVFLTPEKVVGIQETLGVDIMMVLDECLQYPATEEEARASLEITLSWAKRSKEARSRAETLAFGIVQGGMFPHLRKEAAERLVEIGFDGYALGGLSVGEPFELMREITQATACLLPENLPRYLMGVGKPRDIVMAVAAGVDMFDCVIPTRNARHGRYYVGNSFINIRNAEFRTDSAPIDETCDCYTCRNFSRAYLSHLIHAGEFLAFQLGTIHNLRFFQRLMFDIRRAIVSRNFLEFSKQYGTDDGI